MGTCYTESPGQLPRESPGYWMVTAGTAFNLHIVLSICPKTYDQYLHSSDEKTNPQRKYVAEGHKTVYWESWDLGSDIQPWSLRKVAISAQKGVS